VRIETPAGHGTGFLCFYNDNRAFCGIATAHHVVAHADQWQQPIRINHYHSNTTVFLKESDRVIWADSVKDSAVILISTGQLNFPEAPIQLIPSDRRLPIGREVGWLGYPAIAPYTMCFFSGSVSAFQEWRNAYLIDGVAINGVSGGLSSTVIRLSGCKSSALSLPTKPTALLARSCPVSLSLKTFLTFRQWLTMLGLSTKRIVRRRH
jgi:hypothetical protein